MSYYILTSIGDSYAHEVGTEGHRRAALGGLEQLLKTSLASAKLFAQRPAGPQVASNLPEVGSGRVKALVRFHTEQQKNTVRGDELDAQVIRIRKWLFRQGARLTPKGKIIWPKSKARVVYDKELEKQDLTKVSFRGGMLFTSDGKPLDTKLMVTHFSGPGFAVYVMSAQGNLHVGSHSVGHRHHSSLLAGSMVAGAGELQVTQGRLVWLSNKSGHYQPDVYQLMQVLCQLEKSHVPLTFRLRFFDKRGRRNYADVDAFMTDNGFDNATYQCQQINLAYKKWLTPKFYEKNRLAFLQSRPGLLGGIYDLSSKPPRRVPFAEFEDKMKRGGMHPETKVKPGTGR